MERENVVRNFKRLVEEGRNEFVLGPDGNEIRPDQGFAVGAGRCQNVEEAVERLQPGQCVGYWTLPDGSQTYIDIVELYVNKATAMLAAYARGQVSIYDFSTDKVINCSHFYDNDQSNEGVQDLSS